MRTSFNIHDDVVKEFDRVCQEEGLENQSRAVREAMKEYIESHSRPEEITGEIVALVGFDYLHHEVIRELHGLNTTTKTSFSTQVTLTRRVVPGIAFYCGPVERVGDLT